MSKIVNIQPLNAVTFDYQDYSSNDTSLISSTTIDVSFDPQMDQIEYFIYSLNNTLLYSNSTYPGYKIIDNQISINPQTDLEKQGYIEGQYNTLYNFVSNKLASSPSSKYYIDEISSDRTEIRLNTTTIPNENVIISTNEFISQIQNSELGYLDFYINFGNNKLIIANNVLLDTSNSNDPTVLIKLYEPLPDEFSLKTECWVVEKIAESIAYNISLIETFDIKDLNIPLKGPNLNIDIKDQINNSTNYTDYKSLTATTTQQGSGSYYYQLNSILAEKGININVDYTNYSNFIYFSSAQTRLENFYYKLSLIEQYQTSASFSSGTATNYYVSSSNIIWQSKINDIITNFDGYEYHLYFDSGSTSWPKSNSTYPYTNVSVNSIAGLTWYNSQFTTAVDYDSENDNLLINTIPLYLLEDPENAQLELFVEMLGQMFDNIYLYLKDVTNKYNSDNRVDYGVSRDIVADILKDFGLKIYQNNFSSDDLYSSLIGITNSGSLYNLPYTTGSLPTPTGWEYINLFVTASATGSLEPTEDINAEIYKRLYHNLPYILKKKGTVEGLRTLTTIFGIPDTILRINEFGGKDKNFNTWDQWQDEYNYAFITTGSAKVSIPFTASSTNYGSVYPKALEFRFKTFGLPTSSIPYSQSIVTHNGGAFNIVLEYTGSGYTSGSYNGSIINPNYEYATLKFISGSQSASVYLPFYDGGWWSVLVNANSGSTTNYTLYAKNKIYDGYDGNKIGFQSSSSFIGTTFWSASGQLMFGTSSGVYTALSGAYQEIRYYNVSLSESAFNAFVMNPSSIEGNTTEGSQSSKNSLFFRLPLGGELYTGSTSIHPGITGSFPTQSFANAPSTGSYSGSYTFISNVETFYYDQPAVGIQNIISDKIRTTDLLLPITSSVEANVPNNKVLSPFISVQQNYPISSSYTNDINYVEVAYSPQNEINEDIMSSLGYFNIGDYIGDPRQISSTDLSYPDLNALRDLYFTKYISNYDWNDFVRLIKFFDNSLFKMIKDFTPAKSDLASGIVIKQHLLERNKYPVPQMNFSQSEYTASISMYDISGSDGGAMDITSIVTQSWTGAYPSVSGSVPFTQDNQSEFFDGQFSGSEIGVSLNEEGYKVVLVDLFSTSSTNTIPDATPFVIPYDIKYDKTYILSFDFGNLGSAPGPPVTSGSLYLKDNTGKLLFSSTFPPGSGSAIVEVKNAFSPLSFSTNNQASGSGFISASNVVLSEYQLVDKTIDPVLNNILDTRLNTVYMDVDYTNNALVPVNQQLLLSGSAARFPIPDSNYTILRSINPRYNGSRTTSPGFNKPIYADLVTFSTQSQKPNVSGYSNYFVYFDFIETSYPEVPNGGNVHGVYIITTEGQAIPLKGDNTYINEISNIFPSGTLATILPAVYAAGKKNPQVTVFDGGAQYQTIVALSGSTAGASTGSLGIYDPTSLFVAAGSNTFFSTGSTRNILDDDVSGTPAGTNYFIDILQWDSNNYSSQSVLYPSGYFSVYNKNTNQYITGSPTGNTYGTVNVLDTLLPVQQFDYVRLGDSRVSGSGINISTNSSSIDYSFTSMNLLMVSTTTNIHSYGLSTLVNNTVAGNILGTSFLNQNYRIFRRLPDETNIIISSLPNYTDPGFLIPENFNPNYNPYDLAKKAGVIT